jgi:pimeloyl-ACP methyl ester carboxylesterase
VALAEWGSFHVGGREVVVSGQPAREVLFSPGGVPARVDPNGTYLMGQMYAQYMVPAERAGGRRCCCGTAAASPAPPGKRRRTPRGLAALLPPPRLAVYVSDAVERGRSGWTMIPEQTGGTPVLLTVDNPFERFRIGAGQGSFARGEVLPGNQFPADRDSYMNFMRQVVPRFTTTDDLTLEAYLALLDRVGPSVVVAHSQAGLFGWRAAQERPDKVRALVLVEPAAVGDAAKVAALRNIPVLMVYGDYIAQDSRWPTIRANGVRFAEAVRAAGGSVDVVDLPERGIRGNSHMVMMDRNGDEVAALAQDWLAAKGLWR